MAKNIKDIKEQSIAKVNAALSVLQLFPSLLSSNTSLSYNVSTNPFQYIMDLLKPIIGYDKIINLISKFITWQLPVIEASVKTLLIAKMKDIISCSINPFLNDEIIKNGVAFSIDEIDIVDTFKYSPFDKKVGYLYYFQHANVITNYNRSNSNKTNVPQNPEECKNSDDMNCLLWFMINKANKRYTWKPKKCRNNDYREDYPYEQYDNDGNVNKTKKCDGIVTFEFNERANSMKDAYGNDFQMQTPYNNILHVFIGDARENMKDSAGLMAEAANYETQIDQEQTKIDKYSEKIAQIKNEIEKKQEEQIELEQNYAGEKISQLEYTKEALKISTSLKLKQAELELVETQREVSLTVKNTVQNALSNAKSQIKKATDIYFPFLDAKNHRNYYYGRTLIEWNLDYIWSLSLFDPKSLTARLIDCLTGVLTIDLNLSYKQQLIKNEVSKMVQKITESDDLVVSDCFFSFSNDAYDEMSRTAELRKAGFYTNNGDETSAVQINAESILSGLNELNTSTSQEQMQTVIEGTLTELSKMVTNTEYEYFDNVNYGIQLNFIEQIMNALAYALVMSVLSPKVYLLLLINLKIIGRQSNFNLTEFINQYKQLIADLIRSIRDQLLTYLKEELMKLIKDIVKQIAKKITVEQAQYYARLIKQLLNCLKLFKSGTFDFSIDDVDYADIYDEETTSSKNKEC